MAMAEAGCCKEYIDMAMGPPGQTEKVKGMAIVSQQRRNKVVAPDKVEASVQGAHHLPEDVIESKQK
jgi:hypothetical protein